MTSAISLNRRTCYMFAECLKYLNVHAPAEEYVFKNEAAVGQVERLFCSLMARDYRAPVGTAEDPLVDPPVHAVSCLLKFLLKSLPETIFTNVLYHRFLVAAQGVNDRDKGAWDVYERQVEDEQKVAEEAVLSGTVSPGDAVFLHSPLMNKRASENTEKLRRLSIGSPHARIEAVPAYPSSARSASHAAEEAEDTGRGKVASDSTGDIDAVPASFPVYLPRLPPDVHHLQALLAALPPANFYVLEALVALLKRVMENRHICKMKTKQLARIFAPLLLKRRTNSLMSKAEIGLNVSKMERLVLVLMKHHQFLFSYADNQLRFEKDGTIRLDPFSSPSFHYPAILPSIPRDLVKLLHATPPILAQKLNAISKQMLLDMMSRGSVFTAFAQPALPLMAQCTSRDANTVASAKRQMENHYHGVKSEVVLFYFNDESSAPLGVLAWCDVNDWLNGVGPDVQRLLLKDVVQISSCREDSPMFQLPVAAAYSEDNFLLIVSSGGAADEEDSGRLQGELDLHTMLPEVAAAKTAGADTPSFSLHLYGEDLETVSAWLLGLHYILITDYPDLPSLAKKSCRAPRPATTVPMRGTPSRCSTSWDRLWTGTPEARLRRHGTSPCPL